MLQRCGMHESKAAVMNLASSSEGDGTASRIRKGISEVLLFSFALALKQHEKRKKNLG